MPYLVIWTGNASQGIERAYLFLAEKNEDVAIAAIKTIREKALLLEQFPNAGRPVDDLDPEHRELLIPFGTSGYVMVYEIHADRVFVLAVRHQKESGY